jgi:hypothetical protein
LPVQPHDPESTGGAGFAIAIFFAGDSLMTLVRFLSERPAPIRFYPVEWAWQRVGFFGFLFPGASSFHLDRQCTSPSGIGEKERTPWGSNAMRN